MCWFWAGEFLGVEVLGDGGKWRKTTVCVFV